MDNVRLGPLVDESWLCSDGISPFIDELFCHDPRPDASNVNQRHPVQAERKDTYLISVLAIVSGGTNSMKEPLRLSFTRDLVQAVSSCHREARR